MTNNRYFVIQWTGAWGMETPYIINANNRGECWKKILLNKQEYNEKTTMSTELSIHTFSAILDCVRRGTLPPSITTNRADALYPRSSRSIPIVFRCTESNITPRRTHLNSPPTPEQTFPTKPLTIPTKVWRFRRTWLVSLYSWHGAAYKSIPSIPTLNRIGIPSRELIPYKQVWNLNKFITHHLHLIGLAAATATTTTTRQRFVVASFAPSRLWPTSLSRTHTNFLCITSYEMQRRKGDGNAPQGHTLRYSV